LGTRVVFSKPTGHQLFLVQAYERERQNVPHQSLCARQVPRCVEEQMPFTRRGGNALVVGLPPLMPIQRLPPIEALRAWLLLFVDAVATKQIIAPALNTLVGDPKKVFELSYAQMWEAIRVDHGRHIRWRPIGPSEFCQASKLLP